MPSRERDDRRAEAGDADDRVQDQVGLGRGDQLADALLAGEDPVRPKLRGGLLGGVGVGEGDDRATPCSRACAASRSQLPAGRQAGELELVRAATTSSACSPIEPVEPRIRTRLAIRGRVAAGFRRT